MFWRNLIKIYIYLDLHNHYIQTTTYIFNSKFRLKIFCPNVCQFWHQELVVFWTREHWTGLWERPQYPNQSRRELVTISLLVERLGLWVVGMIIAQHLWQISLGFVSALVYWRLQSFVMPAADLHGWGGDNKLCYI